MATNIGVHKMWETMNFHWFPHYGLSRLGLASCFKTGFRSFGNRFTKRPGKDIIRWNVNCPLSQFQKSVSRCKCKFLSLIYIGWPNLLNISRLHKTLATIYRSDPHTFYLAAVVSHTSTSQHVQVRLYNWYIHSHSKLVKDWYHDLVQHLCGCSSLDIQQKQYK